MDIPKNLKYAKTHEWLLDNGDGTVTVGISEHAQEALGDIVFVELPEEGRELEAGEDFGVVESVKAASDVYSPVSGEVIAVNSALEDNPETINDSPYQDGWLMKLKILEPEELEQLLDAAAYKKITQEEG